MYSGAGMAIMRRSGSWQSVWDDRILEIAEEDPDRMVSVGDLKNNDYIRIGQSQISRRCKKLADKGLLRKVGHGVYLLTDEGGAYLREEYDAEAGVYIDDGGSEPADGAASGESGANGA